MESSPIARVIITVTGAKAINWFTPWVVQISANKVVIIGIKIYSRSWNILATLATAACNDPDLVIMSKAPPENRITSIKAMRLQIALTMYSGTAKGFTGVRSMKLNWDGSMTLIPWAFSIRSYWPAGIIQVIKVASKTMLIMMTNVCGI